MKNFNTPDYLEKIAQKIAIGSCVDLDQYSQDERTEIQELAVIFKALKNQGATTMKPSEDKLHETLKMISFEKKRGDDWGFFRSFKKAMMYTTSFAVVGLAILFIPYQEPDANNISQTDQRSIVKEMSYEIKKDFREIYRDLDKLKRLEKELAFLNSLVFNDQTK